MPYYEIIFFIIAVLIMLVGLVGIILPVLPGVPLIFGAAFLYALVTGFRDITGQVILVFAVLAILSFIFDWLAATFGVKKMGGSYAGIIGAFIGMIVGLLLPGVGVVGFIIGAFIGAFVMEMLVNKESKKAFRAGVGSFIGFMIGGVMKFTIGAVMIGVFVWKVLF